MVMRQGQACTVVVSDMRTYVPNAVYLFACKGEIACMRRSGAVSEE